MKLKLCLVLKLVSLFCISFTTISCNSGDNSTLSDINNDDLTLEKSLLGGWKFSGNYLYFNADGTYLDSTFINPIPRDPGGPTLNTCSEIKKNGRYLNQITEGLYRIENGLLKMEPLKYSFDCSPLNAPGCYLYSDRRIEFKDDTLKLTSEYVWKKNGNNNKIYGSWKRNYWAWSYHTDLPSGGSKQYITETITIFPDSSVFHQEIEGLPYDGKVYRRAFNYNEPILNITDDNTSFILSLENDEMHWLYRNWTTKYIRIK